MLDFRWLNQLWLGWRLLGQTTERGWTGPAPLVLGLPATGNLFTVAGGRIMMTSIVGEIMTGCDANPTACRLTATPTVGTARDICAALDIASYAIGNLLGITGVPADAMLPAVASGTIPGQTMGVIVKPGVITLNVAVAGQVLGRVRWTLHWIPLDTTASVAAA